EERAPLRRRRPRPMRPAADPFTAVTPAGSWAGSDVGLRAEPFGLSESGSGSSIPFGGGGRRARGRTDRATRRSWDLDRGIALAQVVDVRGQAVGHGAVADLEHVFGVLLARVGPAVAAGEHH